MAKGQRRSIEERIAAQKAELERLERLQRAKELENDPRLERINSVLATFNAMFVRAKRTVNGAGRGEGAAKRIEELHATIADLTERLERDSTVLLHVEDHIRKVEALRDDIVAGKADPDVKLPAAPECLRPGVYKLTQVETEREAEAKIRAMAKGEGTPAPETSESSDETSGDALSKALS